MTRIRFRPPPAFASSFTDKTQQAKVRRISLASLHGRPPADALSHVIDSLSAAQPDARGEGCEDIDGLLIAMPLVRL